MASKSPGPCLAHGSWFVPVAALPPEVNSRWAQISRRHWTVHQDAGRRCAFGAWSPPLELDGGQGARRRPVYEPTESCVNLDVRRCGDGHLTYERGNDGC